MDWQETFLGSTKRKIGTAVGGFVLFVVLLFLAGVIGIPAVVGFENSFGTVNESTTVVLTDITVDNPNPFGIALGGLSVQYTVSMNDVEFGYGEKNGLGLSSGRTTVQLRTYLNNSKIPPWWVSHIRNGEETALEVTADIDTGFGYSTTRQPVDQTITTDILGAFNTSEDQPINSSAPLVENPVAVIRQRNASFGSVSSAETPIEISFVVYNPKDVPITVSELSYDVSMNQIDVGEGTTERTYVIEPKTTETIRTTVNLRNQRLDEWWVSHLQNEQVTRLFIDFSARISVEGVSSIDVPLRALDYETYIRTNIFGGGNASGDSPGTTTGGAGSGGDETTGGGEETQTDDGTETTPTTSDGGTTTTQSDETDTETTTSDGGQTTTEDDGVLGIRPVGGFNNGQG